MKFLRRKRESISSIFNYKTLAFLLLDAVLISLSFFIAFFVINRFSFDVSGMKEIFRHIPFAILIYWLVFEFFEMYRSLWRFASIEEVTRNMLF